MRFVMLEQVDPRATLAVDHASVSKVTPYDPPRAECWVYCDGARTLVKGTVAEVVGKLEGSTQTHEDVLRKEADTLLFRAERAEAAQERLEAELDKRVEMIRDLIADRDRYRAALVEARNILENPGLVANDAIGHTLPLIDAALGEPQP